METQIFDRIYMSSPTVVVSDKGLYPRCEGQLHSPKLKALFCAL